MMAAKLLSVSVVLCVVASALAAPKIGDFITPCNLKDPKLGECMTMKAREILPKIVSGVEEWGLPSLDPHFVPKMELQNSGTKAVGLEVGGYNLTLVGFKDMEIESIEADPESLHFEVNFLIPNISTSGRYKLKGKILLLAINGQGASAFYHEKQHVKLSLGFKTVEKDGQKYMHLDKAYYKILGVAKARTVLDNLFGNKQLSDNMNKILNDNSMAVLAELQPRFERSLSDMVMAMLGPMFDRVPMKEFFPDA